MFEPAVPRGQTAVGLTGADPIEGVDRKAFALKFLRRCEKPAAMTLQAMVVNNHTPIGLFRSPHGIVDGVPGVFVLFGVKFRA